MEPFSARVPPEPVALRPLRGMLREWLLAAGLPPEVQHGALLAVNEAAATAIEHAHPHSAVEVRVAIVGGDLVAEVRDAGLWRQGAPSPGRGRGLAIIAALVDDLQVRHGPAGTAVRMVAHL